MKKLFIAIFTLLSLNSFAQFWKTIEGNGQLKKETREVGNYTKLASHGPIDVQIAYGNSNTISVEADENLLPYIETSLENGKLSIRTKKNTNIKSRSKMVVYVTMSQINSLQQSGSGTIRGNGAFTNNGKTDISLSGSGNIKLGFDSFKDISISLSGSGNMELKSAASNNLFAQVSGSGNIDCSTISCNDVNAKISGSGNIKVNAKNNIDATISGSGNIYYNGNVANIKSKISGSGKMMKM